MEIKFVPTICRPRQEGKKKIEAEYDGYVVIKALNHMERMELTEAIAGTMGEGEAGNNKRAIGMMKHAMASLDKRVVEVAITRKSDGFQFKTFEDMQYDSDMFVVLQECVQKLIEKFSVPKPS